MAVYKVPQDVEAEDKLIGPFSFRQFIYLIIAVVGIALAWGLSQLFLPLLLVPLPLVLFFGALALPLKKDQPMEVYLAALVSFYLKPRKRLWKPDGIQSLVEITAPKVVEVQRAKSLTESEAERRLSYLADIADTRGWSVRGAPLPQSNSPLRPDAYYEAQQTEDVLDDTGGVSKSFDTMITQADARRKQDMVERMKHPQAVQMQPTPPPITDPYASLQSSVQTEDDPKLDYNPYPTSIRQSVIKPLSEQTTSIAQSNQPQMQPMTPPPQPYEQKVPDEPPPSTSEKPISPDIISLANNSDLSIETIAHEAQRIHQKEALPEDEVVISLR